MWKVWMEAAGIDGIPTAFVVDAAAKIAWVGHPTEIDEPLRLILEGKYNPQAITVALRFRAANHRGYFPDFEPIADVLHVLCYLHRGTWVPGGTDAERWSTYVA